MHFRPRVAGEKHKFTMLIVLYVAMQHNPPSNDRVARDTRSRDFIRFYTEYGISESFGRWHTLNI
jgi:hypothetical protein